MDQWGWSMSIKKYPLITTLISLALIGIVLISMATAGSTVVTSSTGKNIVLPITPYKTTIKPLTLPVPAPGLLIPDSTQLLPSPWSLTHPDYEETTTACCGYGNPFIKPYANASIYYPETSTASGLTNSFGTKRFFSSSF
jgi:hypothetical protein